MLITVFLPGGYKMDSLQDRVFAVVAKEFGVPVESSTRETSLVHDLGAESLDVIELKMELEEEFSIRIPDELGKVHQYWKMLHH